MGSTVYVVGYLQCVGRITVIHLASTLNLLSNFMLKDSAAS